MDEHLEHWFTSIRQYMELVINTPVYTGMDEDDAIEFMYQLGFIDPTVMWYDGTMIKGTRDGIEYTSAWCVSQHTSDNPKYNFLVCINEFSKNDTEVFEESAFLKENEYKYLENCEIAGDIPPEFIEFKTKLIQYCNELSSEHEIWNFYPSIVISNKHSGTMKEIT